MSTQKKRHISILQQKKAARDQEQEDQEEAK
jgi:hypothetical protein